MKLRNMPATVDYVDSIMLKLGDGENVHLTNAYVLTSYASRVAVYCKRRVYLLPRYDYSVTTWRHLRAFVQDYCKCEGCVNWPCEGVCALTEHVETY